MVHPNYVSSEPHSIIARLDGAGPPIAHSSQQISAIARPSCRDVKRAVIERTVEQVFGVAHCDLRRSTRGRAKVARARQVAMYLAHVVCGMTLTDVGRLFDRDRTTVSHACSVIEDERDNQAFDRVLELLEMAVLALLRPRALRDGLVPGAMVQ
ncbi:MAG: chromosomal replication initiator DnaA [Hyphomicrobiaceae bacterium]|nr:chromosomal replication initiator DnaA [Hyphomicrobiaceae bacterium]